MNRRDARAGWNRHLWLGLLLAAGACRTPGAVAFDPRAEPVRFHEARRAEVRRRVAEFEAKDGKRLGYVEYRAADPRAVLVYLHGIESHAGWFEAAAEALCASGYDVYCLDRRGSGINRENRGFTSGHVDDFETLLADIESFLDGFADRRLPLFLVGLSWGGKLALAYSLTHPDQLDGLVLITPGLVARVAPGVLDQLGIVTATWLYPTAQFKTPIEPEMFTTTPEYLDKLRRDPLRLRYASARFFYQSVRLDGLIEDRIEQNQTPIQLFLAGRDQIICNEGVVELLLKGGRERLEVVRYEDQTHSIQFDATDRMVQGMSAWIEKVGPRSIPVER